MHDALTSYPMYDHYLTRNNILVNGLVFLISYSFEESVLIINKYFITLTIIMHQRKKKQTNVEN